jgi:hypothetical protein
MNPVGMTAHKDYYQQLAIIQKKYGSKIYLSKTVIQKDPEGLVSCGAICVEMMNFILTLPASEIAKVFTTSQELTEKEELCYAEIDLSATNLLPASLRKLVETSDPGSYRDAIIGIRTRHFNILGNHTKLQNIEIAEQNKFLEGCLNSDEQILVNKIVLDRKSILGLESLAEYQRLSGVSMQHKSTSSTQSMAIEPSSSLDRKKSALKKGINFEVINRQLQALSAAGDDRNLRSHGKDPTYWYSIRDGLTLLIEIRQSKLHSLTSNTTVENAHIENQEGVFITDPYHALNFSTYLQDDLKRITGNGLQTVRWASMPRLIIIPVLLGTIHWHCVRVEIDYSNKKVDVLLDDPYGKAHFDKDLKNHIMGSLTEHLKMLFVAQSGNATFVLNEEGYKELNQQGSNGCNCGPIVFSNIADYTDVTRPNQTFVNGSLLHVPAATNDKHDKVMRELRVRHIQEYCQLDGGALINTKQIDQIKQDIKRNYEVEKNALDLIDQKKMGSLSEQHILIFFTAIDLGLTPKEAYEAVIAEMASKASNSNRKYAPRTNNANVMPPLSSSTSNTTAVSPQVGGILPSHANKMISESSYERTLYDVDYKRVERIVLILGEISWLFIHHQHLSKEQDREVYEVFLNESYTDEFRVVSSPKKYYESLKVVNLYRKLSTEISELNVHEKSLKLQNKMYIPWSELGHIDIAIESILEDCSTKTQVDKLFEQLSVIFSEMCFGGAQSYYYKHLAQSVNITNKKLLSTLKKLEQLLKLEDKIDRESPLNKIAMDLDKSIKLLEELAEIQQSIEDLDSNKIQELEDAISSINSKLYLAILQRIGWSLQLNRDFNNLISSKINDLVTTKIIKTIESAAQLNLSTFDGRASMLFIVQTVGELSKKFASFRVDELYIYGKNLKDLRDEAIDHVWDNSTIAGQIINLLESGDKDLFDNMQVLLSRYKNELEGTSVPLLKIQMFLEEGKTVLVKMKSKKLTGEDIKAVHYSFTQTLNELQTSSNLKKILKECQNFILKNTAQEIIVELLHCTRSLVTELSTIITSASLKDRSNLLDTTTFKRAESNFLKSYKKMGMFNELCHFYYLPNFNLSGK